MADSTTITQPRLGAMGWARWTWRNLTSMRTALFLLLLLAIGALPGSIWPQRSIDPARTADWIAQHPKAGPVLDRLGFFEVYASPWFAAIYLLLFISLVGCVLPRSRVHWRAMRSTPPRTPSRLERLDDSARAEVDASPEQVVSAAREVLRGRRFRVHSHDDATVSAENGYLKETGNLVFHLALIGVIVGVAIGHLLGWKGDVIVPVGKSFSNTLSQYDTFDPGPWVNPDTLQPFTITVDKLDAKFEENVTGRGQFGQPRDFTAHLTTTTRPGARPTTETVKVNHPLEIGGAGVFLLGNGYAPVVTVKDAKGQETYSGPVPFLAQDNNYRSVGAIKVTGADPKPLGFSGLFLPTAVIDKEQGPISIFPDAKRPALALTVYEGELLPGGRPQSVYVLDTSEMTQLKDAKGSPLRIWLEPGQTYQLPGGRGSITFDSVDRFAGLSIRHDPGKGITLVAALLALAGLIASLVVRRRRVFVRVSPAEGGGRTVVTVAGLAKGDDDGLRKVVEQVLGEVTTRATAAAGTTADSRPRATAPTGTEMDPRS
ncbi:cytochrome c biogenesis protein ResB [Pedococcus sp. NPDC057267]|uniref:cytochrome c biogenesis protein ResB n=1 Tax=Pedococcus sp. NPDC057267 TaxID=3346077 RepID=UPI0036449247